MLPFLLGIDIGTTSTKGIIIDTEGKVVAETARPTTLSSAHAGWAEEDPCQWWNNLCEIIPELLGLAGLKPEHIRAVGASGMVPTLILLDQKGEVIRPSIQQNDARAVEEITEQQNRTDQREILQRTGSAITQQSIGPKLLWLARHEPDNFQRAAHIMGSYDYVAFRLTGEYSSERNWALESGLYDLHREDWSDDLLALAGIDRSWLGALHWPADVTGLVTRKMAAETGLPVGIPVVAGSADHIASAFSAGLKEEGDLLVKLGGAGDILFSLNRVVLDPRLFLDYHDIPGKYLINGCMATSGSLIRWVREQFMHDEDYGTLDEVASHIRAGSEGLIVLPYFLGEKTPLNDPLARGTILGLTLSHTRSHIYRAVLEGIAYGFYHHLTVLAEHDLTPRRVRLTNGGAHSILWRQITADVLGLPLEQVASHPGSSLGAAFVAGIGSGSFGGWDEIERYITIASVTEPNPENHARYLELFKLYRDSYESLKHIFPALASVV